MSDLEHRIKHGLEPVLELADPRERISAYHDMPYALFRYEPDEEFDLRKQVRLLETRLTQKGKHIKRISLAECLNEAMCSQRPLQDWFAAEREQGTDTIVETVHSVLSEYAPLVDLVSAGSLMIRTPFAMSFSYCALVRCFPCTELSPCWSS